MRVPRILKLMSEVISEEAVVRLLENETEIHTGYLVGFTWERDSSEIIVHMGENPDEEPTDSVMLTLSRISLVRL